MAATETVLDQHAALLAAGDDTGAARMMAAAGAGDEARALMRLAATVRAALPPVAPAPAFRDRLYAELVASAPGRGRARARRRAWRLSPGTRGFIGGAAVATIGIAAVMWLGRPAKAPAATS